MREVRTRAKQAEARQLYKLLGKALTTATDGVVVIDANHRIVFFNRGAEVMFGYSAAEVKGQPLTMLMPARFKNKHAEHVETFAVGTTSSIRIAHRGMSGLRKNGQEFEVEASITKIEDGSGLFMAVMRDVSDRHDIEDLIRVMAESAEDMISIFDKDKRFIYTNPAWKKVLGYSPEELPETVAMADIVHPEDYGRPRPASVSTSHQLRMRHKNGSWVWVEGAQYPVDLGPKNLTVGWGRDISARKREEAEAEKLLGLARNQTETIGNLLDAIADSIVMVNRRGECTFVNNAACRHMGREKSDILGRSIREMFPGFEGTGYEEAWQRAMESPEPTSFEAYYAPRDRWFSVHFFPVGGGLVVHSVDVTEFKNTQAAHTGLANILTNGDNFLSPDALEALNLMPDPIAVLDEELRYTFVNKAGVGTVPVSDVIGKTPWEMDLSLKPLEQHYREAVRTKQGTSFEHHYEPAGKWFAVELIPSGTQLMVYTSDITKQKKSEQSVSQLTDMLEQALDLGGDRKTSRGA